MDSEICSGGGSYDTFITHPVICIACNTRGLVKTFNIGKRVKFCVPLARRSEKIGGRKGRKGEGKDRQGARACPLFTLLYRFKKALVQD